MPTEPNPESLVAALRGPSPRYKRAEVDAVVARLGECEPHLVEIVREIGADPVSWDEAGGHSHMDLAYALILLSRARSTTLHGPLLRLLHHPGEEVEEILGDLVTESLPWILFVSAAGEDAGLRRLALDRAAGEWIRSSAMDALRLVALEDEDRREELIALASAVIQDPEEEVGAAVVTRAADLLVDLRHRPSRRLLIDAAVAGHLDPFMYTPADIDELLDAPPQDPGELAEEARSRCEHEDPHEAMSWWDCFAAGSEAPPPTDFLWDDPRFREEEYFVDEAFESWSDELLRRFGASPEGRALPDLGISWLDLIFRFALDYEGVVPADIDPYTLRLLLLHIFPRKVSMEPTEAGPLVREAEAFFRFAGREFGAENADACSEVLTGQLAAEMEPRLADSSSFGMAKSFFAAGAGAGFDMSTEEGANAAMLAYNAGLFGDEPGPPIGGSSSVGRQSKAKKKKNKRKRKLAKKSRRKNR